jgi:hypothetical protein
MLLDLVMRPPNAGGRNATSYLNSLSTQASNPTGASCSHDQMISRRELQRIQPPETVV